MNGKQKLFCEEYIKDLNGKQAALRAGYAPRSAQEQASRLLSNDKVQEYIQSLRNDLKDVNIAQAKDVLKVYTDILLDEKAKPADRLKAGELLSKHLNLQMQQELEQDVYFPDEPIQNAKDLLKRFESLYQRARKGRISGERIKDELAILNAFKAAYETTEMEDRLENLEAQILELSESRPE